VKFELDTSQNVDYNNITSENVKLRMVTFLFNRDEMLAEIVAQSIRAAADAAQINERALKRMLLGKRKCGLEEYVRMCGFLGASVGEFIGLGNDFSHRGD